ncbi:PREDICTED: AT-hook motif nuclear-localized protein 9-like [Lupinus angustifolius]|uniref:AT-hook motif nuclear-localized protein 9-like n=1 Tax=Lupinus angustifolius TaxID=3871 RepID=UPI00092F9BF9|nr:PREDICTED: AT-hook motif nuclear-localized protein 9-like [Lupinus angustifolius]
MQGWFEILSLSGSYTFVADGDAHCKKGMLNILLAGPDGSVSGGILEGSLIAAGPIQLVVASFKQNMIKEIMRKHSNGSSSAVVAPDLERVPQNVQAIIDSTSIPTQNVIPTTTTIAVSENVIPANQNIQSASVNGVGLNSSIKEQNIAAHDNASV